MDITSQSLTIKIDNNGQSLIVKMNHCGGRLTFTMNHTGKILTVKMDHRKWVLTMIMHYCTEDKNGRRRKRQQWPKYGNKNNLSLCPNIRNKLAVRANIILYSKKRRETELNLKWSSIYLAKMMTHKQVVEGRSNLGRNYSILQLLLLLIAGPGAVTDRLFIRIHFRIGVHKHYT